MAKLADVTAQDSITADSGGASKEGNLLSYTDQGVYESGFWDFAKVEILYENGFNFAKF